MIYIQQHGHREMNSNIQADSSELLPALPWTCTAVHPHTPNAAHHHHTYRKLRAHMGEGTCEGRQVHLDMVAQHVGSIEALRAVADQHQ